MPALNPNLFFGIKIKTIVLFWAVLWTGTEGGAWGQVPTLDVEHLQLKATNTSRTGETYLFKVESGAEPPVGTLILLKRDKDPVAAVRVVRNENVAPKSFIARKVRLYGAYSSIPLDQTWAGIYKIGELSTAESLPSLEPPPTLDNHTSPAGASEILPSPSSSDIPSAPQPEMVPDTRKNPREYDPELDASTTPRPEPEWIDDESDDTVFIEEYGRINPYNHSFSAGFGTARNLSNFGSWSEGFSALQVAYGYRLGRDLWFQEKKPQDSLGLEVGFQSYSRVAVASTDDSYQLFPIFGQLIYEIDFAPWFALHGAFGFQYNWITSSSQGSASNSGFQQILDNNGGIQQRLSVGAQLFMGHHWNVRFDVGWEFIGAGLTIRW